MTELAPYDHVLSLRAIRDYRPDPLAEDDLTRILEAARWTGSSKNQQSWAFVVVDDPEQRDRLAGCGTYTTPIRNAPVTVVIVQEPGGNDFDSGRAAHSMMLAASALGVVSCPVTLHRHRQAAEALGLPEGRTARYAVAFGYPSDEAEPARWGGRKPLDELVHRNRYRG